MIPPRNLKIDATGAAFGSWVGEAETGHSIPLFWQVDEESVDDGSGEEL